MKTQKIKKFALPALLMSAMTFLLLPGSVVYRTNTSEDVVAANFFTPPVEGLAGSCLILAGMVTFLAMLLALVALCFKKNNLYKLTGWCSLGAAALASEPYMEATAESFLQPNVVIILLLTGAWLLAMHLNKQKDKEEETPKINHL